MRTLLQNTKLLGLLVVLLVLVGLFFVHGETRTPPKTVTAHFSRAVSIYPGSDVRILGVNVGTVTSVTPDGDSVAVDMTYDARYDLPADAKAVIITPTLVADRFVQLTPVYTSGPALASGADIALADTAVPVELDRIYSSLQALSKTLGPNGVNKDGTLNHLLTTGDDALHGEGARGNRMIQELAKAATTFGDSSGDLFDTVSSLADFTDTLRTNDATVRTFLRSLSSVSTQLAGERSEIARVLAAVARAVGTVQGFVRDNRGQLVTDVQKLTHVLTTISSERGNIDTALKIAPVAMGNLVLAFDTKSGSEGSRIGISGNTWDADGFLCAVVQQSALPTVSKNLACQVFKSLLTPLENQLPTVPPGTSTRTGTPGATAPGARRPGLSASPARPVVNRYASDHVPTFAELLMGGTS